MILVCKRLPELKFGELMRVYEEGNLENAMDFFPDLPQNQLLLRAEQEFYQYLKEGFFSIEGAFYCVLEEKNHYVSALRLEPYRDGVILEALETAPDQRRKGYACSLMEQMLALKEVQGTKIYSHVSKRNEASLRTHLKCGFQIISDMAVYVDGSVNDKCYTLCHE